MKQRFPLETGAPKRFGVGRRTGAAVMMMVVLAWLAVPASRAQWVTQTNTLSRGWNAVYLHVDASYTNLASLVNADPMASLYVDQIQIWNTDLPAGRSLATPPQPGVDPQFTRWDRGNDVPGGIPGRTAMLVHVADGAPASFAWPVKGRPVAPAAQWSLSGLNLIGFPTVTPSGPSFRQFLLNDAQPYSWIGNPLTTIFRYAGGGIATNPVEVTFALRDPEVPVMRDQAYWIRAGDPTNQFYNRYFGPFLVTGSGANGIRFGDSVGQTRLFLKNMSRSNVTVTLRLVDSEAPPAGQGLAPARLPLLVRGPIHPTNLTFSYVDLAPVGAERSWALAAAGEPGSEAEVVLGVDRVAMEANPAAVFGGVLRFTDSLGMTRVEIGASASKPSRAGLWVGAAAVDRVGHFLQKYVKATNVTEFHARLRTVVNDVVAGATTNTFALGTDGHRYEWDVTSGHVLVYGGADAAKGRYLVDGPVQQDLAEVARPFPLRLIVHHDGTTSRLLQRAYVGRDQASNEIVATLQAALASTDLGHARRISAAHLPTTDGVGPWSFVGNMQEGAQLETVVELGHSDHGSNPFLHTYHPDHDNLDDRDPTFSTALESGRESYRIRRSIRLAFTVPGTDFDSRVRGGAVFAGNYFETVSIFGTNALPLRQFGVSGSFGLNRINGTSTLVTRAP